MKILVCDKIDPEVLKELSLLGQITDISNDNNKDLIYKEIVDSSIVVIRSATTISKDLIDSSRELKIIARAGVGVDNIDIEAATQKNIYIINAPYSNVISAAEITVGLILSVARNIVSANISMKNGEWNRSDFMGIELFEKQLGLVGFGKVGNLVAERMLAFGMKIGIYDPYIGTIDEPYTRFESLDELLKSSDVISLHLIKTSETLNLISKEKLDLLKKEAIFINASRGGIVDEEALLKKKERKEIYGFGLDVYASEPPEFSESLLNTDGITLPHLGASTKDAQFRAGIELVDNIKKVLDGNKKIALNFDDIN